MDLNTLIALFKGIFEGLSVLGNVREILDIIMASLKQSFGKAEEPAEA